MIAFLPFTTGRTRAIFGEFFFFRHTRCLASTQASCFALHRGQLADRLSALMQSQELCLVVDLRSAGSDKDQAVRAHPRSRCIAHSPNQSLQAKDNVDIFTDCVSDAFEVASEQVTAQLTGPVVSELDLTSSLAQNLSLSSICHQVVFRPSTPCRKITSPLCWFFATGIGHTPAHFSTQSPS